MALTEPQKKEAAELLVKKYQLLLLTVFGKEFIEKFEDGSPEKVFFKDLKDTIPPNLYMELMIECYNAGVNPDEFFKLFKDQPAIRWQKITPTNYNLLLMEIHYIRKGRNLRLGEALYDFIFTDTRSQEAIFKKLMGDPTVEGLLEFIYDNKDSNRIQSSIDAYEKLMKETPAPHITPLGVFVLDAFAQIKGAAKGAVKGATEAAKTIRQFFK